MNNKKLLKDIKEYLKYLKDNTCNYSIYCEYLGDYLDTEFFENIEKLIKVYKEQEKEIYNIKELTTFLDACIMTDEILDELKIKNINKYNFILAGKQYFDKGYFKEKYISKDKIKRIFNKQIKEYEKEKEYRYTGDVNEEIEVLEEMLKDLESEE